MIQVPLEFLFSFALIILRRKYNLIYGSDANNQCLHINQIQLNLIFNTGWHSRLILQNRHQWLCFVPISIDQGVKSQLNISAFIQNTVIFIQRKCRKDKLHFSKKTPIKSPAGLRFFICPLVFGCCESSHLIFLKWRKKELLERLSKFTK